MVPLSRRDPDHDVLDKLDARDALHTWIALASKIAVGGAIGAAAFLALRFGALISAELSADAGALAAILVVLAIGIHRSKIGFQ
jgi:hypothetical protein